MVPACRVELHCALESSGHTWQKGNTWQQTAHASVCAWAVTVHVKLLLPPGTSPGYRPCMHMRKRPHSVGALACWKPAVSPSRGASNADWCTCGAGAKHVKIIVPCSVLCGVCTCKARWARRAWHTGRTPHGMRHCAPVEAVSPPHLLLCEPLRGSRYANRCAPVESLTDALCMCKGTCVKKHMCTLCRVQRLPASPGVAGVPVSPLSPTPVPPAPCGSPLALSPFLLASVGLYTGSTETHAVPA